MDELLATPAPRFNRLRLSIRRVSTSLKDLTTTIAVKTKLALNRRDSNESTSSAATAVDAAECETRRSSDAVECKTDVEQTQEVKAAEQLIVIANQEPEVTSKPATKKASIKQAVASLKKKLVNVKVPRIPRITIHMDYLWVHQLLAHPKTSKNTKNAIPSVAAEEVVAAEPISKTSIAERVRAAWNVKMQALRLTFTRRHKEAAKTGEVNQDVVPDQSMPTCASPDILLIAEEILSDEEHDNLRPRSVEAEKSE
jgi:hypothetical protein